MSQESNFIYRPEDFDFTPSDSLRYAKRPKRQRSSPNSNSSGSTSSNKSNSKKRRAGVQDSPGDSSFSSQHSTPRMSSLNSSSASATVPASDSFPSLLSPDEFAKLDEKGKWEAYMKIVHALVENQAKTAEIQKSFMADMLQMRAEFKAEISELKETINQLKSQQTNTEECKDLDLEFQIMMAMNTMKDEPKKQEEKRNNLVIYGLPEIDNNQDEKAQQEADKKLISEIIEKSGQNVSYDDAVVSHFRMGQAGKVLERNGTKLQCPRLLKLRLKSSETRDHLLKKQKEFLPAVPAMRGKNYSQYIREDLTAFQRRLHGKMVEERNKRNAKLAPGQPRWKIYDGGLSKERPGRQGQNNQMDLN